MSAVVRGILVGAAVVAGAGCLDDWGPDVGPPLNAACVDGDSDLSTDVSYRDDIVPQLFEPSGIGCFECHSPDAPTPIGFEVGGLDLSTYETMRSGGAISGTEVVVPGMPCESTLVQKIGPGPPFGSRMPLDGPPFVSEADRQLLHDWIAEGAVDN